MQSENYVTLERLMVDTSLTVAGGVATTIAGTITTAGVGLFFSPFVAEILGYNSGIGGGAGGFLSLAAVACLTGMVGVGTYGLGKATKERYHILKERYNQYRATPH